MNYLNHLKSILFASICLHEEFSSIYFLFRCYHRKNCCLYHQNVLTILFIFYCSSVFYFTRVICIVQGHSISFLTLSTHIQSIQFYYIYLNYPLSFCFTKDMLNLSIILIFFENAHSCIFLNLQNSISLICFPLLKVHPFDKYQNPFHPNGVNLNFVISNALLQVLVLCFLEIQENFNNNCQFSCLFYYSAKQM